MSEATARIKINRLLEAAGWRFFLVDRLELEDQARKVFTALLAADFHTVV